MLARPDEEGAVDDGVAVVDGERVPADDAERAAHACRRQRREQETARVVVPLRAFVLHLSIREQGVSQARTENRTGGVVRTG